MKAIPNILSIFRICLVPVFIIAYFLYPYDAKWLSAVIYAVATLTDFLDGYLARRLDASSKLGRLLDPLGDKLIVVAALVCFNIDKLVPLWAVVLTAAKEILMAVGGFIVSRKIGGDILPSNLAGKTAAVVFFAVSLALLLFRSIPPNAAAAMVAFAIVLTFGALGVYLRNYILVMKSAGSELPADGGVPGRNRESQ